MSVKSIIIAVITMLALAAGGYYYFAYPPTLYKRIAQHALDDFGRAIATKDRAKISDGLKKLLADPIHIRLEVRYFSILQQGAKPMVEEFDKAGFAAFIDNILYSLQDYAYSAEVQEFKLSDDKKSADLTFSQTAWGDGISYYAGTGANVRFYTDTLCAGKVFFEGKKATLGDVVCKTELATLPKEGEENKLRNPEAIREIMR